MENFLAKREKPTDGDLFHPIAAVGQRFINRWNGKLIGGLGNGVGFYYSVRCSAKGEKQRNSAATVPPSVRLIRACGLF